MILELARVLLLPLFLGAGALRALGIAPRSDRLAWLGWCWVAGACGTGLVTFLWLWTPLSVNAAWGLDLLVVALGAWLFFAGRDRPTVDADAPKDAAFWERVLFGLAVAAVVAITVQRAAAGNVEPVFRNDEAHFWTLKAKVIYHSGGFNPTFAEAMSNEHFVYHKDYPLLNPLLAVWTFAHFGEITHVVNRLPIQMFALSLALVLAGALRRVVRPAAAAAILLAVFAIPEIAFQSRTAHADLMVGFGALLAFDAWLRHRAASGEDARAWWRLCAVGLAFMLWSKNEGLLYAVAIAGAWVLPRLARPRELITPRLKWMLLPAGVIALSWGFNAWYGFENDIAVGDTREHSYPMLLVTQARTHVPYILGWVNDNLLWNAKHAAFLPLAMIALALLFPRRVWSSQLRLPCLAVAFAWLGYLLVFTGTPHELEWHLPTAASRVSQQSVPAMALWIALAAGALLPARAFAARR